MAIVIAAFNHAVKEEEILDSSPISGLKKSASFPRITYFTEDEIQELLDYCNRPLKKKAVFQQTLRPALFAYRTQHK